MNKRNQEILERKRLANVMNFAPPTDNENFMLFGQRARCIRPTVINARRERLGYNPERFSMFEQCKRRI